MAQLTPLRRTPQQARSRETVLTILVAAARVLLQHGAKRLSTNRVAKVAGVSVGSLYQYFSGKSELLTQLAARRVEVMTLEHSSRARRVATQEEALAVTADVAVELAALEFELEKLLATDHFQPTVLASCQRLLMGCLGDARPEKLELVSTLGASSISRAVAAGGDWRASEGLRRELRGAFGRHLLSRAHDSGVRAKVPLAHTA